MIDHRILQQIGVNSNTPVLNLFQNALTGAQSRRIAGAQNERAEALAPFQQQLAQQNVTAGQQAINANRGKQRLSNIHATGQRLKPLLASGNIEGAKQFLLDNISQIQSRIEQGSGEDVNESMEALAKLQAGDVQGLLGDISAVEGLVNQTSATAGQREFTSLTTGLSKEDKTKAARIKLRLDPGASLTGQERIALNDELGEKVVRQLEAEAGATEGGKLTQQLKHKPAINKAVKLAEAEAKERGEVLTDVARMEASLPGVKEVVNELVELSSIATSTFAGRLFDSAVKESGFGSTKGADAKAKLIAIVDNQVLPLLKETFGAAFTVQEGENLKASLVDPNASPSQKRAQLEAFIAQKERNLRTKQSQLDLGQDQPVAETQQIIIRFDAQGNQI